MQYLEKKRVAIVALASLLVTGAVGAALLVASAVRESGTLVSVLGWVAPILAGVTVGVVVYLMLESRDNPAASDGRVRVCEACGAELLDDWRMCPSCGAFVDDATKATRRDYQTRTIL